MRVGLAGVEVVRPEARDAGEIEAFLVANEKWIIGQLERIERFRSVRKPQRSGTGEILYRGTPTPVYVEDIAWRQGANKIMCEQDCLVIMKRTWVTHASSEEPGELVTQAGASRN